MRSDTAPIGRIFRSIECESSRVGEVTGFVHVADGPCQVAGYAWSALQGVCPQHDLMTLDRVVLDTCEASYFDWSGFARAFLDGGDFVNVSCVLETRGERPEFDRCHTRIYLHWTEGLTKIRPEDLRAGDEVKILVHDPDDVSDAIKRLGPFLGKGIPCFLLPRAGTDTGLVRDCFRRFLSLGRVDGARMMLIGHELVGID